MARITDGFVGKIKKEKSRKQRFVDQWVSACNGALPPGVAEKQADILWEELQKLKDHSHPEIMKV